jgi:hypothetical protein
MFAAEGIGDADEPLMVPLLLVNRVENSNELRNSMIKGKMTNVLQRQYLVGHQVTNPNDKILKAA